MKYIDLDQPSRTSAGADSAIGAPHAARPVKVESPQNDLSAPPTFAPTEGAESPQMALAAPVSPDNSQATAMSAILQRVLGAVEKLAGSQQQATAQITQQVAQIEPPKSATQLGPNPLARTVTPTQQGHKPAESARANYSPWGRYIKKPVEAAADHNPPDSTKVATHLVPKSQHQAKPRETQATLRDPGEMASASQIPEGGPAPRSRRPSQVSMGSPATELATSAMDDNSRKIINHENKHAAVLRDSTTPIAGAKPQLTQQQGPDGRKYAVAGEVNADLAPIPGNPQATEHKAESVYRSAMGDADRSDSDQQAARSALFAAQEARQAKVIQRSPDHDDSAMESPRNAMRPRQSPYAVKMSNPLFALAGLAARGLMAAGGAVARGAVGRGLTAAGGAIARSAIGKRVAMAGARVFAGGKAFVARGAQAFKSAAGIANKIAKSSSVQLVSKAFEKLNDTTEKLTKTFDSMSERYKAFSPALSIQLARNQLNQMTQDMAQARRLGPGLAEFEKQKGRIELAKDKMGGDFTAMILPFQTMFAKLIADIMELGANITATILGAMKTGAEMLKEVLENIPWGKQLAALINIEMWIKQWKPPVPNDDEMKKNLNDFFSMEIPAPHAKPKLLGAKFNMVIPKFDPQPFGVGN